MFTNRNWLWKREMRYYTIDCCRWSLFYGKQFFGSGWGIIYLRQTSQVVEVWDVFQLLDPGLYRTRGRVNTHLASLELVKRLNRLLGDPWIWVSFLVRWNIVFKLIFLTILEIVSEPNSNMEEKVFWMNWGSPVFLTVLF